MVKATWRILALSALMGAVALPASAQAVIGGSAQPSVVVNWAVLDSLGRQPTLPDMLKNDPGVKAVAPARHAGAQPGIVYRPYNAQATKPAAKRTGKKAVAQAQKPKITPVAARTEIPVSPAVAQLVRAAQTVEPVKAEPKAEAKVAAQVAASPAVVQESAPPAVVQVSAPPAGAQVSAPPAVAPQVAAPPAVAQSAAKPAGPQVALPEVKPTPVAKAEPAAAAPVKAEPLQPASAPVQVAKVDVPPAPVTPPAPTPVSVLAAPALTPAPQPMARPEQAPAPQVAALPNSGTAVGKGGDTISVVFSGEDAKLPGSSQADLHALAKRMSKDEGLGLQLLAYAAGDDSGASKARRLSLSRALEVRKYLMEQGVRSTRIEVRALGNKLSGNGPADRVDAVVVTR